MFLSSTNRILFNTIATYSCSLLRLVAGIFSCRWGLMALGNSDYGLLGLIVGFTNFITFFNTLFSGAIGRFFAYSIGKARKGTDKENEDECCKWFNIALMIHSIIPFLLLSVGYPLGVYAVKHWLTIPPERIGDCIWVFRFVCIMVLFNMITVPYVAMYTAKQYIAELTGYHIASIILNLIFLYMMTNIPRDWFVYYSLWTCLLSILPQIAISFRAMKKFPECKILPRFFFDLGMLKTLLNFTGWQFFGQLGYLTRTQGVAILVNKAFGPIFNSTMALSNTISVHSQQLAISMNTAIYPAITSLAGEERHNDMLKMTYRACKFSLALTLLFLVPVSLELPQLLNLWLKNPPPLLLEASYLTFCLTLLDSSTNAIGIAITAIGKIKLYYILLGGLNIISLPILCLIFFIPHRNLLMVYCILIIITLLRTIIALLLAKRIITFSPRHWCLCTGTVLIATLIPLFMGILIITYIPPSLFRIVSTAMISCIIFMISLWRIAFSQQERIFIQGKINNSINRFFKTRRTY